MEPPSKTCEAINHSRPSAPGSRAPAPFPPSPGALRRAWDRPSWRRHRPSLIGHEVYEITTLLYIDNARGSLHASHRQQALPLPPADFPFALLRPSSFRPSCLKTLRPAGSTVCQLLFSSVEQRMTACSRKPLIPTANVLRTRWHKPLQCDIGRSGISAYSTEQHAGNRVHAPDWGVAADSEQSTISGFGILRIPLDTCQCCDALVAPTPSASPPRFMIWHESASPCPIHDLDAILREQLCFPRRRVILADRLLPSQVWSHPKQISTSSKWF